jgi:hypothetical protein
MFSRDAPAERSILMREIILPVGFCMQDYLFTVVVFALLLSPAAAQPPKQGDAKPANPTAALNAYKQALDRRDPVAFANLTAGAPGAALRKLAPALKKAQDASEKFNRALADKPALSVTNPFLDQLDPLQGYHFEVVELAQENRQYLARIRFGRAGKLSEETVSVTQEGDIWRVSLPGEYLKSVQRLTPERLDKEVQSLTKLADVLNTVAEEVSSGKLTTKEAVLLRLAALVKDAKLGA